MSNIDFDFKGGAGATSKEEFVNRKRYKETAKLKGVTMLDTYYQNQKYGLLNRNFEPVCLNTDLSLANLLKFEEGQAGLYAANFVVRAFESFRRYYVATTLEKRLNFPPVIGEPTPVRAFINFDAAWGRYINTQIENYARLIKPDLVSIGEFPNLLFNLIESNVEEFPITKSGFLLSNKCPNSVNGLTIELADIGYDQDSEKSQFFNSYEYGCFAELAYEMGFYIDKNAPWRLIANLDSPIMKNYILQYMPDTTAENILDRTYRKKTHHEDITAVYFFYGSVLQRALSMLDVSHTPDFSEELIIEETLKIRMLETGMDMKELNKFKAEVMNIHKLYSSSYPNTPLKPASAKIGKICAEKIKEIYLAKSQRDSYNKNTIKEFM